MPETQIRFTLPLDLYEQSSDILNAQGLTVEDTVALLFRYIATTGKIPFNVHSPKQSNPG